MEIIIKGAREHNLKNIDLKIGDGLTVVTGVSGSGKTSLVFDTLYHEARRRMYDVISLGRPGGWRHQLAPARVEEIHGLGPSIAVEQNVLNRNPNSTLATASGLHPFIRLLYSNFGSRHCVECGTSLQVYSEDEIVERLGKISSVSSARVYVPLMRNVPGSHRTLLEMLADQFSAASIFVDREPLGDRLLDPEQTHDIDVFIGTLQHQRTLAECRRLVQDARAMGGTSLIISKGAQSVNLNFAPVCTDCGTWFAELEPRYFHMDCPLCRGDGCRTCSGSGIHPLAYAVSWEEHRFPDLLALTVDRVGKIIADCDLPATAERLLWEIARRVETLKQVGLGYLSLDRSSPSLSRGESQRVRLAVSLTSRLEDMLYVLDEPTIGQHSADVARFLPALKELPGPVVFVEHDRLAASIADRVIDLGPGAGVEGGHITFSGTPAGLLGSDTPTGLYFSQRIGVIERVPAPPADQYITLEGINRHNLRDLEVSFPVARLTVITGVSGSGKSTLVEHVLYPTLKGKKATGCEAYHGKLLKPVLVDQNPIGRNPRSNPATYTKLSDLLRELYARVSGLTMSHFSFNRPEGACPACKGMGAVEVKMQYLYSFWIPCEDCEGMRFNEQVLNTRILFDDRLYSIADFYRLSISEVAELLVVRIA